MSSSSFIAAAAIIAYSTAPAAIVSAPPSAIVASPLTEENIAPSKLENVIDFSVPASEKINLSLSATPVPPKASRESISTPLDIPVKLLPSPSNLPNEPVEVDEQLYFQRV